MQERRVSFTIQIAHNTSAKKLAIIPQLIEDAFQGLENVRFSRAHFQSFATDGACF